MILRTMVSLTLSVLLTSCDKSSENININYTVINSNAESNHIIERVLSRLSHNDYDILESHGFSRAAILAAWQISGTDEYIKFSINNGLTYYIYTACMPHNCDFRIYILSNDNNLISIAIPEFTHCTEYDDLPCSDRTGIIYSLSLVENFAANRFFVRYSARMCAIRHARLLNIETPPCITYVSE